MAFFDTGIKTEQMKKWLCDAPRYNFSGGNNPEDINGHGTLVASIAIKGMDSNKVCILPIKMFHDWKTQAGLSQFVVAFYVALKEKVSIINISMTGKFKSKDELSVLRKVIRKKIHVVVAAGNDDTDLSKNCNAYPACYPIKSIYFHVVGNNVSDSTSNYSGPITDIEYGKVGDSVGTSYSAPIVTRRLILELLK